MTKQYQQDCLDRFETFLKRCHELGSARDAFEATTKEWRGYAIPYHALPESTGNADFSKVPSVCLRIPTGGGKTRMAAEAIARTKRSFLNAQRCVTLWLVPSEAIREQTLRAMKQRGDVVCETLREMGCVAVLGLEEAMSLQPGTLETSDVIIVSTMQAFKREDSDALNVFKQNGQLMAHFSGVPKELCGNHSLVDALRLRRPFIVVDEAHNQGTELAFDTLAKFGPSAILELTATPDRQHQPSNVLYSVSASALQGEDMIKMPVEVHGHPNENVVLREALAKLNHLQTEADEEAKLTGAYVRPVMLLQGQNKSETKETVTPVVVKRMLMEDFNIPENQIAIHGVGFKELDDVDVMSADCPLRFIITVDQLKEGWDCAFAHVLCTFRESASSNSIEQLLGRILRQPYQTRKKREDLNKAYAFAVCTDSKWMELVQNIGHGLVKCGFQQMETKDLVIAPQVIDPLPLWQQNTVVSLPVKDGKVETLDLTALPPALVKKLDVTDDAVTLPATLTPKEEKQIIAACPTPELKAAVTQGIEHAKAARLNPPKPPVKSPAENGERLVVPLLAIRQGSIWEEFDETHLLEGDWSLQDYRCELNEKEFPTDVEALRRARLSITELERLKIENFDKMEAQLALFEREESWSEVAFLHWLERNLPEPTVTRQDKAVWLRQALRHLMETRKLSVEELAYRKFRLRAALAQRLKESKHEAEHSVHQKMLLEDKLFGIREDCSLVFELGRYVYDEPYRGPIELKRHFFPMIGNLKVQGEEFECAQYLANECAAVETWVRNVEKKPGAFSLQTSTDRFYPDFLAKLKDGRLLAVEYKGGHLYAGAEEKRMMGELWEKASGGKCVFAMPTGKDWSEIERKIAA